MAENKKEKLEKILKSLDDIGDVLGSAIISSDGLSISSNLNEDADAETLAAMTAAMHGAAETAMSELKQGKLRQIIIDAEHGKLVTISAGENAILVVLAKPQINIGLALLELGRASGKISDVLGG
jgi:predicted regulator of Ras-like GTPase activity (Roadblock/LC7/MglB family)